MEKPFIKICGYCQKEFPEVDRQVKSHTHDIDFSHGICQRHSIEFLKAANYSNDQIKDIISKKRESITYDLEKHPELVDLYSNGIFDKNPNAINERLKKLANIIID